jgi:hypothetical protein
MADKRENALKKKSFRAKRKAQAVLPPVDKVTHATVQFAKYESQLSKRQKTRARKRTSATLLDRIRTLVDQGEAEIDYTAFSNAEWDVVRNSNGWSEWYSIRSRKEWCAKMNALPGERRQEFREYVRSMFFGEHRTQGIRRVMELDQEEESRVERRNFADFVNTYLRPGVMVECGAGPAQSNTKPFPLHGADARNQFQRVAAVVRGDTGGKPTDMELCAPYNSESEGYDGKKHRIFHSVYVDEDSVRYRGSTPFCSFGFWYLETRENSTSRSMAGYKLKNDLDGKMKKLYFVAPSPNQTEVGRTMLLIANRSRQWMTPMALKEVMARACPRYMNVMHWKGAV